jgi:uncharacterized protein YndB with AHSA1/START domain
VQTELPVQIDPRLDLVIDRVVDAPRHLLWQAWTQPEHVVHWFVPRPWTITSCEIDLRPGGAFNTVMRSPEGEEFPSKGCYLEVVPEERFVFTDALLPGFRPAPEPFFTAIVTLEARGDQTRYVAIAIHRDEAGREQHEQMGFMEGWNTVLDQLVEYVNERM